MTVMGSFIRMPAIAFVSPIVSETCRFGPSLLPSLVLAGCEYGLVPRCWRSGDFAGTGGGGDTGRDVGGGEDGLAIGIGFGPVTTGYAPGIGGGTAEGGGVAGLELRTDSGLTILLSEPDGEAAGGRKSSFGLLGLFGGGPLGRLALSPGDNCFSGAIATPPSSLVVVELTRLPASLPLKLPPAGVIGPETGTGGGDINSGLAGPGLLPLDPASAVIALLMELLLFVFLNFHLSLSSSLISSTPCLPALNGRRCFFSAFRFCESVRCKSFALPILLAPALSRLACSCARLAWISARESAAAGGGANIVLGMQGM